MAQDQTIKVWKVSRTASAGMMVSDKSAIMAGSANTAIIADEKGITLAGPISMVTDASGIRRGGLFVGLNDFLDMIPSTMVTPIPKQIPMPPIFGLIGIAKDVSFFRTLLV